MKKPTSLRALRKLPIPERLEALAEAAEECAERCGNNMLVAGTWIEESFKGIADRMTELAQELRKDKR